MVYLVIGGFSGEGERGESAKIFSTLEKAMAYADSIEDDYDYVDIEEREIDQNLLYGWGW